MPAFTAAIPNLLNGVSTQAAVLRLVTQGDIQINGYSTLTKGLIKRPPSKLVKNLGSITGASSAHVHTINRDPAERYIVLITNGDLKVFDINGNEKTVAFPDGKTYLNHATPRSGFAVTTVADYTFIANKSVEVAMDATLTPTRNPEALVHVIAGNYGKIYSIDVNGTTVVKYKTPNGNAAYHGGCIGTDFITKYLKYMCENATTGTTNVSTYFATTIEGSDPFPDYGVGAGSDWFGWLESTGTLTAGNNWSLGYYGNAFSITKTNGDEFTITGFDDYNNNAMKVIKKRIQRFTDLPVRAPDGFHVEITGESSNDFDNYYVKFEKSQSIDNGDGVWRETLAQGIEYMLDAATMPHILVRETDGTFTFKQATWSDRIVGDTESSPDPSFVGQTINDVFFHRNRLGFLAGENVILSAAGDFFNFWRTTCTAVLDTDPIDIGSSHRRVSVFHHAEPYNGDLLLFGESVQLRMTGGDILTPKTAALRDLSEYPVNPDVKPVVNGSLLYWVSEDTTRAVVRELYVDETNNIQKPLDANSHCPEYISSNIFKMAGNTDLNLLTLVSADQPTRVYVYKYYWVNTDKPQASWSHWEFGKTVLSVAFIETNLYVVLLDGSDVRIVCIPCQPDETDTGMDFMVLLDQRVTLSGGSYDGGTDKTTYTMPYTVPADIEAWTGYNASGTFRPGYKLVVSSYTGTTLVLDGDTTNETVYAGKPYTFQYRFSPFYLREASRGTNSEVAITEGRTQILRTRITYGKSAYFSVEVTPENVAKYTYNAAVNAYSLDDPAFSTTELNLESGDYSFPVKCENTKVAIDILNNQAVPCAIVSAEWVGLWYARTRR